VRGGPSQTTPDQVPPEKGQIEYTRPGLDARLRITIDDQAFEARVFVGDQPRSAPIPVSAMMSFDLVKNAVCHDLNHDGVTDFIATISDHGNGLGAAYYHRLVALSDGASYRFWTLETMWPDPEDLVTFGRIEPIVMVTRDIVHTHGPERYFDHPPERSYIVHDLWAFHGSEVVSVNSIDERFPVWIRFTYTPNYLPAKSVDAAAKLRWRPAPQTPVELSP
jgi:hypothetical protein